MNTQNYRKFDVPATLACTGVILCWSLGPIFIKLLTKYTDVWIQNLLRYAVSCLFWLPFLLSARKKGLIDKCIWRRALLPACANVIMQSCWAGAFYFIDPTFMNLIIKTTVIWIAVFSLILFPEERPLLKSIRFWAGAALSTAGVLGVIIFCEKGFTSKTTLLGIIITLSAAIMWGVYTVSVKIAFKNIDSRYGFSVISIYTVAGLAVLAIVFGDIKDCTALGLKPWMYIIVSSLLSIAFSHVLYYFAIKRVGAIIPALSLLVVPFIVFLLSSRIFGESLTILQWVSGVALLAGSTFAIWSQKHLTPRAN
jgi:drug/metabolite transporter (DMT)-like permease